MAAQSQAFGYPGYINLITPHIPIFTRSPRIPMRGGCWPRSLRHSDTPITKTLLLLTFRFLHVAPASPCGGVLAAHSQALGYPGYINLYTPHIPIFTRSPHFRLRGGMLAAHSRALGCPDYKNLLTPNIPTLTRSPRIPMRGFVTPIG